MNEQHALIENVGNKTVIASWEPSPTNLNRRVLVFQGKDSFMLRYSNRLVQIEASDGAGGYKLLRLPLGAWWLSHRDRRQHRGVTFRQERWKLLVNVSTCGRGGALCRRRAIGD
jgi:hypothetical protein